MPEGNHSRLGYQQIGSAFGAGAPGTLRVAPRADGAVTARGLGAIGGSRWSPGGDGAPGGLVLIGARAGRHPRPPPRRTPSTGCARTSLPAALVDEPAAENYDLDASLASKTLDLYFSSSFNCLGATPVPVSCASKPFLPALRTSALPLPVRCTETVALPPAVIEKLTRPIVRALLR